MSDYYADSEKNLKVMNEENKQAKKLKNNSRKKPKFLKIK